MKPKNLHALLITAAASYILFALSWIIGYILVVITALFSDFKITRFIPGIIKAVMEFIYIVPIVLIVSVVNTQVVLATLQQPSSMWYAIAPLSVGVYILSGYQIFDAGYKAAVVPDDRSRNLVDAIYIPWMTVPVLGWISAKYYTVKRRIDCDIRSYEIAIFRALHLAFVAVVIVEMVTNDLYGQAFDLAGVDEGWRRGVGGQIARNQGFGVMYQISGLIWGIFFADFLAQGFVRSWTRFRFSRHYTARRQR